MARNLMGCTTADVAVAASNGALQPGSGPWPVYTTGPYRDESTAITDLTDMDGTPISQVTFMADGVLRYYSPDDDPLGCHWLDVGQGLRIAVRPVDIAGESAYDVAVGEGFEGTEGEWLASLKGDKGDKGDTGAAGATAAALTTKGDLLGHDGANGVRLPVGDAGAVLHANPYWPASVAWTNILTGVRNKFPSSLALGQSYALLTANKVSFALDTVTKPDDCPGAVKMTATGSSAGFWAFGDSTAGTMDVTPTKYLHFMMDAATSNASGETLTARWYWWKADGGPGSGATWTQTKAMSNAFGRVYGSALIPANTVKASLQVFWTSSAGEILRVSRLGLCETDSADAVEWSADGWIVGPTIDADLMPFDVEAFTGLATYSDELIVLGEDGIATRNVTKNLYNPADPDVLVDQFLNSGTTTATLAGYTTSGFIPVTAGLGYAVSNVRSYAWYTAAGAYLSGYTNTGDINADVVLTAPGTAAFLRTCYWSTCQHQVEQGSEATAYEPWNGGLSLTTDMTGAVLEAVSGVIPTPVMSVVKSGNAVTITSMLDGAAHVESVNLAASSNGGFNFVSASYDGLACARSDDITPIRTQLGTVGANHGYANVAAFTNPDGKTAADFGSTWEDTAGREYVLLGFDSSDRLVFGGDYTVDAGVVSSATVAPVTDLTHKSGATHTGTVSAATKVSAQLWPSVGRMTVALFIDGERITDDGTYGGTEVEIRESYDILDYQGIYDTAAANVGTSYATLPVAGAVGVTNVYRWRAGGRLRITTSLDELAPTTLAACGGVQSAILSVSGTTTTRYVPGVTSVAGSPDWGAGVDMTSYASTTYITDTHLAAAGVPPAFHMDVLTESSTPVAGFAMGYLPHGTRPDSATNSSTRDTKVNSYYDMRSTKKCYPAFTSAEAAGWSRLGLECFRYWLSPDQIADVLAASGAREAFAALDATAGVT